MLLEDAGNLTLSDFYTVNTNCKFYALEIGGI
jgi:hypothetical protein